MSDEEASKGVAPICSAPINADGTRLIAARGSVVDFTGGAIVNAANEGCLGGGGVDGAISRAGGDLLAEAREALPVLDGRRVRCYTGHAKSTISGDLACEYVIHTVGPNYSYFDDYGEADVLLYMAYHSAVLEALALGVSDVAFCLVSAGIFRGRRSLRDVLALGVLAASAAVARCKSSALKDIFIVAFTPAEVEALSGVVDALLVSADKQDAVEELLQRVGPRVREIHARAMGGASEPLQPPIGYAMAQAAATTQYAMACETIL